MPYRNALVSVVTDGRETYFGRARFSIDVLESSEGGPFVRLNIDSDEGEGTQIPFPFELSQPVCEPVDDLVYRPRVDYMAKAREWIEANGDAWAYVRVVARRHAAAGTRFNIRDVIGQTGAACGHNLFAPLKRILVEEVPGTREVIRLRTCEYDGGGHVEP